MRLALAAGAVALVATGAVALAGPFKALKLYPTGPETLEVQVADLNRDGRRDLIVTNRGSDDVSILRGKGTRGRFASSVEYPAGPDPFGVAVGDYNRDGRRDLAIANQSLAGGITVLLGNGAGFTLPPQQFPAADETSYVVAAHLDGDRKLDLAATGLVSSDVTLLKGDGNGGFTDAGTITAGVDPFPLVAGDFNRDGDTDIVVGNSGEDTVSYFKGQGNLTFASPTTFPAGAAPNGMTVGRIDDDRRPDIAIADYGDQYTVLLSRGGGFASRTRPLGESPADVTLFNFDGEGPKDLAFVDADLDKVHVLPGRGERGRFGRARKFPAGAGVYGVAKGRFNDDRLDDLATAAFEDASAGVLLSR
jgi:hypothetical protein